MTIQSYDSSYLPYISETIGTMLEYIANNDIDISIFWNTFINSSIAKQIENGNPKYLSCSAIDLIDEISKDIKLNDLKINKNCYYWAGWILTQLQYKTSYSFIKINKYLPIETVLNIYPTLHEADTTKFFDVASDYFKNINETTNLKIIREAKGLSQSQLAQKANVDIRSIQMYEQKRNDINKAQAETLYKLARVLGCKIEDLLEL